jgi:hypothetical protein
MKSKGDSTMPTGEPMTIALPPELEPWMIAEVVAAIEECDRDPSSVRTLDQVRETLDAAFSRASKDR